MEEAIQRQTEEEVKSDSSSQTPRNDRERSGELLPLDATERMISFLRGGKPYTHVFRRISPADWQAFYSNVTAEFAEDGRGVTQLIDTDVASLNLYARAIVRAEGYRTRDGRDPRELATWPECIPQDHRLIAVDLLMKVVRREDPDEELVLDAAGKTVMFDAAWGSEAPGSMKVFSGLIHRFAIPSAEHRRKFLRAKNRCYIVGGSRRGKTVILSSHAVLTQLYDELIRDVEGYGIGGRALGAKEEIAREMDAFHKAAAVGQVFPTSTRTDEPEEKEAE